MLQKPLNGVQIPSKGFFIAALRIRFTAFQSMIEICDSQNEKTRVAAKLRQKLRHNLGCFATYIYSHTGKKMIILPINRGIIPRNTP